jgi:hypothetical protein
MSNIERSPERIIVPVTSDGTPVEPRPQRAWAEFGEGEVVYVRADLHRGAVEEVERLRGINRNLVEAHNGLLVALSRSESDAESLRSALFGGQ